MQPSAQFSRSVAANITYWRTKSGLPVDQKVEALDKEHQNLFHAVDFGLRLNETLLATTELILECFELAIYLGYEREWLPVLERIYDDCPADKRVTRIRILNQLGNLYRAERDFEEAMARHHIEEELARELEDALYLARANANYGKTHYFLRQYANAEERALAALAYFENDSQCIDNYGSTLNLLGLVAQSRGDLTTAEIWYRESVSVFHNSDLTIELIRVTTNLAILLESAGRTSEALTYYHEAETLAAPTQYELEKSRIYSSAGTLYFHQGDLSQAEHYYRKAYTPYMINTGPLYTLATISNNLGNVCYALGRYTEAEQWLEKSVAVFRQVNAHLMLANSLATLARTLIEQGQLNQIHLLFNEAMAIVNNYPEDAFAQSIRSELALVQGAITT